MNIAEIFELLIVVLIYSMAFCQSDKEGEDENGWFTK